MINCIITLSKRLWNHEPQASGSAANFDKVMTTLTFIINKLRGQKHKKTDVNLFFTITRLQNGQMSGINEGKRRTETINRIILGHNLPCLSRHTLSLENTDFTGIFKCHDIATDYGYSTVSIVPRNFGFHNIEQRIFCQQPSTSCWSFF